MKHSKSPLTLAILLALSSPVFAAPGAICPDGVCEGPITQQAEVDDILFNEDKTTLTFKGQDGFDVGLRQEDLTRISRIEGKGDVTIKGSSTVINHTGFSDVNIYGMKNLTIESDNVDGKATINLTGNDSQSKKLIFGHAPGKDMTEGQYLDSLTITAKNGNAFTVKPEEGHDGKLDVRIRAKTVLIETEAQDGIAVEANGNYGLKKGHADFAFGYSEDNDGNEIGLPEDKDRDITLRSPNLALLATNEGGMIVEANGGKIHFDGSVEVSNNGWLELGWGKPEHFDKFPEEWLDEDSGYYNNNARFLDSIILSGSKNQKAALIMENGGFVSMAASDIVIAGSDNKKAIDIKTYKNSDSDSTVLDIHAKNSLYVDGDIIVDFTGEENKSGYVSISSDGVGVINGNVKLVNKKASEGRVDIALSGSKSSFTGSLNEETVEDGVEKISTFGLQRATGSVSGLFVRLFDQASLNLTGDSNVTNVESDGGVIDLGSSTLSAENLKTGDKGTEILSSKLMKNQVTAATATGTGSVNYTVDDKDAMSKLSEEEVRDILKDAVNASGVAVESTGKGSVSDITVSKDETGKVTSETNLSGVVESARDITSTQMLAWRNQINDVNKRLGDLRTYEGNIGSWVRVFGGKSEYGDRDLDNKYTTVQLGADTKVMDNFYVGMTAHYTDGKSTLNNGSSDDKSYGFGVYGGWLADNGQFVDVIVKRTRMDTDFDLYYTNGDKSTGSFDTWGTSVSVEYGWRLNCPSTKFWVEPQVELSYGHFEGVDYTTSIGNRTEQDSMDSLIGRFGVAVGGTFDMGSAYVKASVAHEFDGESNATVVNGTQRAKVSEELDGTFGEVALGGTVNFTKNFSGYGEFQTTFGSPVKSPYQWNVGVRYTF